MIDADALMKAMYHRAFETDEDTMWQSGCWVRYRAVEQAVKDQPTIGPERKKGKWIPWYGSVYMCSECRAVREKENFCPRCGADMRNNEVTK